MPNEQRIHPADRYDVPLAAAMPRPPAGLTYLDRLHAVVEKLSACETEIQVLICRVHGQKPMPASPPSTPNAQVEVSPSLSALVARLENWTDTITNSLAELRNDL